MDSDSESSHTVDYTRSDDWAHAMRNGMDGWPDEECETREISLQDFLKAGAQLSREEDNSGLMQLALCGRWFRGRRSSAAEKDWDSAADWKNPERLLVNPMLSGMPPQACTIRRDWDSLGALSVDLCLQRSSLAVFTQVTPHRIVDGDNSLWIDVPEVEHVSVRTYPGGISRLVYSLFPCAKFLIFYSANLTSTVCRSTWLFLDYMTSVAKIPH